MASRRRLAIDEVLGTLERNGGMALVDPLTAPKLGKLLSAFELNGSVLILNNRRRRKSVVIDMRFKLPKLKLEDL